MSDEVYWQDLEEATGAITDETRFAALQQTQEGGLRRLKLMTGAKIRSWLASLTQTITGVWTFSTGIIVGYLSLSSGRKFAEEKTTTFVASTTGWVTILKIPNGNDIPAVSGDVCVMTTTGYVLSCEYTLRLVGSTQSLTKCTLTVKKPGDSNGNFTNVVNFRWAYSNSSSIAGAKLQVYVITEQTLHVQMWGNIDRVQTYPGAELVTAVHEDTPLLPDGSTASYLEAGTVLQSGSVGNIRDHRISALSVTTTALRISIFMDDVPKQNATTITFPNGFAFRQDGGTLVYTVADEETIAIENIRGHVVTGIIATTGLTVNISGVCVGSSVSVVLS